jgi:hypothetical protein
VLYVEIVYTGQYAQGMRKVRLTVNKISDGVLDVDSEDLPIGLVSLDISA